MPTITVGEAARRISRDTGVTVPPHVISTLFYKRQLDDTHCPVVSQIRLIPEDYLSTIRRVLQDRGIIPTGAEVAK